MVKGYVSLILHTHLPFVRHPESQEALEERWLFEAMTECYLPLIQTFDRLLNDKVKFRITISITPTLMAMFEDKYLNEKYLEYMIKTLELSKLEIKRTLNLDEELKKTVLFYNKRYKEIFGIYKKYDNNLMNAFRKFDKSGHLEIITCAATHGLLPLLMVNIEAVRAQIAMGVKSYTESLGHPPVGIWLPECAFSYGIDSILKEFGIKYFICEGNGVLNAWPKPIYGTYAPIVTPEKVYAFPRDMESGHQVWSSTLGYPGDFNYREFYRDIGFDLPIEYIAPYINPEGIRIDTGLKYYRITGHNDNKEYYSRDKAMEVVKKHAKHFSNSRNAQISVASVRMEKPPIITCPYDTELFGHWWYEGSDFIYEFIKEAARESNCYELTTPLDYLNINTNIQGSIPNPSSWGENGDFSVWLNPANDWIYREIHSCEDKMLWLTSKYIDVIDLQKRVLNQAARELMLGEASDWAFIIKNNTTVNYAKKRFFTHVGRFNKLYEGIINEEIDEKWLREIEELDNIFPNIDYRIYRKENPSRI